MSERYVVKVDNLYLAPDGEGDIRLVPLEEAGHFDSFGEAADTALMFSKDGWTVEALP